LVTEKYIPACDDSTLIEKVELSWVHMTTFLRVTLVHGTQLIPVKRSALWSDSRSSFSKQLIALAEQFDADITVTPFNWRGANSIIRRDRAAESLAEFLRHEHGEFPDSIQIVIAHSHGGNLALRAFERLAKVQPLPLLVTLATPFMSITP